MNAPGSLKRGGKRPKLLEPYAEDILAAYRRGESFQFIADWLAEPPRGVATSRQAVHRWINTRIARLDSRLEQLAVLERAMGPMSMTRSNATPGVATGSPISRSDQAPATAPSSSPPSVAADEVWENLEPVPASTYRPPSEPKPKTAAERLHEDAASLAKKPRGGSL